MWPSTPGARRSYAAAAVVSVIVHGLLAGGLVWQSSRVSHAPVVDFLDIDIEEAPLPAVAETLPPEQLAAQQQEAAAAAAQTAAGGEAATAAQAQTDDQRDEGGADGEAAGTIEEVEPQATEAADAVAARDLAERLRVEAEQEEARKLAEAKQREDAKRREDAEKAKATATAQEQAPKRDEVATTTGDAGAGGDVTDEGAVATDRDADGEGEASTETAGFAAANLLAYFPAGQTVAVLIRFDRLRGTEWAAAGEALIRPLPDYEIFIGNRDVAVADFFDAVVVATTDPNDVVATTLVGRSVRRPDEIRDMLDHPGAPVEWTVARGGALGKRKITKKMESGDTRTFLTPFPGWFVLTLPTHLGTLTAPATGSLDAARADSADLPPWLARVHDIEAESGKDEGPALMLTMHDAIDDLSFPGLFEAPAPKRITMALELDPKGILVRGSLRFDTAAEAATFVAAAEQFRDGFAASRLGKALLAKANAANVVAGLTVKQTGVRVAYGTSVSVADARVIFAMGARAMEKRYAEKKAEREAAEKARAEKKAAKAAEKAAKAAEKAAAKEKAAAEKAAAKEKAAAEPGNKPVEPDVPAPPPAPAPAPPP